MLRVHRLQDKLQNLQVDIQKDKTIKLGSIEAQLAMVDDKITDWHQSD